MLKRIKKIIDAILPPRCLMCGGIVNSDNSLCNECFSKVNFVSRPYCRHCGVPFAKSVSDGEALCIHCLNPKNNDKFRLLRFAVEYDEFSKKAILDFKFLDHVENRKLLTNWLNMAGNDIFDSGVDLIIPVPLHFTRLVKRKYNQSAILAKELSKIRNISVDYKSLKRKRMTIPQVLCSGKERLKNVKNAFEVVNAENIKGKRIVLIDDVYTTGATLRECAVVLLKSGAKSVDALTIARVC